MSTQPKPSRRPGFLFRLPLLWLVCCLAGSGWLICSGLKSAVDAHQTTGILAESVQPTCITKNIEDINVGDYVLAKNPDESGLPTPHQVIGLPRNWTEHVVDVRVFGGGELWATCSHPFWVDGKGWTDAKNLSVGDRLCDERNRPVTVAEIRTEDRTTGTFNLTVDGVHTYYVLAGDAPVLVHNAVQAWQIGSYRDLVRQSLTNDGLVIHHYPQAKPASELIPGYDYDDGLAVVVPNNQHVAMNKTSYTSGEFQGTTEELINEANQNMGVYTQIPQNQLDQLDAEAAKRYLSNPCE
jgi:hypothetical protein